MTSDNEDMPKIVASIMIAIPKLAIGSGVAYLRMKRRARSGAKTVYKELVGNGIPEHVARKLSESYGTDLSIRNIARQFGMPSDWMRPGNNAGKYNQ